MTAHPVQCLLVGTDPNGIDAQIAPVTKMVQRGHQPQSWNVPLRETIRMADRRDSVKNCYEPHSLESYARAE